MKILEQSQSRENSQRYTKDAGFLFQPIVDIIGETKQKLFSGRSYHELKNDKTSLL